MTDNAKRIRLYSDTPDDENQENKRPRIEHEEKIEEYEYVEVTGERMEQILKEETAGRDDWIIRFYHEKRILDWQTQMSRRLQNEERSFFGEKRKEGLLYKGLLEAIST